MKKDYYDDDDNFNNKFVSASKRNTRVKRKEMTGTVIVYKITSLC